MKVYKLVIPGSLPNYNNARDELAAPGDKFGARYRKHKEEADYKVRFIAQEQLRGIRLWREKQRINRKGEIVTNIIDQKCSFIFHWYSKDKNIDPDNICHAMKYIFDGLQHAKVIYNDGWKQVGGGFLHKFFVDKSNPRIEIFILAGLEIDIDVQEIIESLI